MTPHLDPATVSEVQRLLRGGTGVSRRPAQPPARPPVVRGWPCVHRGEALSHVDCPTCTGAVRLTVYACWARGDCTLAKDVGRPVCATCPDRQPPEAA